MSMLLDGSVITVTKRHSMTPEGHNMLLTEGQNNHTSQGHENLTSETEGLFQQRKRCNTAPGSLTELLKNQSQDDDRLDSSLTGYQRYKGSLIDVATEKHYNEREVISIEDRLAAYNKKTNLEAFKVKCQITDNNQTFEGALRFYVNDDKRKLCKAIHMRSTDTVTSLLPTIREKFSFLDITSANQIQVIYVLHGEETVLDGDAKPLDIAVNTNNNQTPRFVVRLLHQNQNNINTVKVSHHRSSSRTRTSRKHKHAAGELKYRGGSIDMTSYMEKRRDNKDSPAAVLIESQRRKKQDNMDDKLSLGRRSGSLRSSRSKSMSSIFQKTFSFRKKEHPYSLHRTELSTEDTAPGVLRVFGDAISPGTQYKSVLASPTSTAETLVKDALERYSIPSGYARHFVMCDVIGQFVPYNEADQDYINIERDGLWQEECIRIIGDNERPLILQSYWKPSEGYSRRFELRNRGEFVSIENFEYNPFSESTPKANRKSGSQRSRHRRSIKDKKNSQQDLHTSVSSDDIISNDVISNVEGENNDKHIVIEKAEYVNEESINHTANVEYVNEQSVSPFKRQDSLGASITGEDTVSISRMGMSSEAPFIMNLKGIDPQNDNLVHFLSKECTVIGCDIMKLGQSDICLPADDILGLHCRLLKNKNGQCSVEPCQGALVKVNNRPILQNTNIFPGDILCLGNHYIFMFRDSRLEAKSKPGTSAFVKLLHSGNFENEPSAFYSNHQEILDNNKGEPNKPDDDQSKEPKKVQDWRQDRQDKYNSDQHRLKVSYSADKEDEVITFILHVLESYQGVYRLSPAYLLCMCIEYSAVRFEQLTTRQLLLKIASRVQTTVLEKTKQLADHQGEIPANPSVTIDELIPDLQPVIMWLVNSLEVLHFLNGHINEYVLESSVSLPAETRHSIAVAEDEVLAVLEDVVMYTFQQTVYYITKTLYSALTAILESNPFNDDDSSGERITMETLLSVYQTTLNFLLECRVHPVILSQFFSYLFFFTNTSLLNTLMTVDATAHYYRWSSGVRLRGNMDTLETWAQENHLHEEAVKHLSKLNCLVDLLATPKLQLLQSDWPSLRRDFPSLNAAQLYNVLSHYNIDNHPVHWQPSREDREAAYRQEDLNESFNSHPQLMLPGQGFMLDLCRPVDDEVFYDIIHELEALFGPHSDDISLQRSYYKSQSKKSFKPESEDRAPTSHPTPSHHVHRAPPTTSHPTPSHHIHRQDSEDRAPTSNPTPSHHVHRQDSKLHSSSDVSDQVPWYRDGSPIQQHRPWSSVDTSYNDSGFATLRSQEYDNTEYSANNRGSIKYKDRDFKEYNTNNMESIHHVHSSRSADLSDDMSRDNNNSYSQEKRQHLFRSSNNKSYYRSSDRDQSLSQGQISKDPSLSSSNNNLRSSQTRRQRELSNNSSPVNNMSNSPRNHLSVVSSSHMSGSPRNHVTKTSKTHLSAVSSNHASVSPRSQMSGSSQSYVRDQSDNADPLYMNMDEIHAKGMLTGNKSSSKKFTHSPLGFSTQHASQDSCSSSGGSDRRQPDRTAPILDRTSKPKPLNRVPPLDLHKLQDNQEYVDVNKTSSLSPRATQNGLRVLPLTTEDRNHVLVASEGRNHRNVTSVRANDRQMVRESDMDEILYRNTMSRADDVSDDVFTMVIDKSDRGLGLGLIDGLYTPLRQPGIYVRTLIAGAPAAMDGRIQLGDRILAVNGNSIVGADYQSAMNLIKEGGKKVTFLVAKSDRQTRIQISASSC